MSPKKTRKSFSSCRFLCETAADGSSALRPGVMGCVAGRRGGSFFHSSQGGRGREAEVDQCETSGVGNGMALRRKGYK